jgi:hypothetical protein
LAIYFSSPANAVFEPAGFGPTPHQRVWADSDAAYGNPATEYFDAPGKVRRSQKGTPDS